ncbi:MAG: NAD(P)H-dependent oxidoreductase subunit E [Holophagaceae bacterium]|nr:NAD(P)H-dependent oxidoreductase subunit E [Holophagaceae bacterium]
MNHPHSSNPTEKPMAPGQRLAKTKKTSLSECAETEIHSLASRYPDKLAAVLPALYVAQHDMGFVGLDAMQEVARVLDIPHNHIYGVATFYTMFHKAPVGRFHFEVCTNICCALRGGARVFERLRERLGVQPGHVSQDGMWSLEEVECLGSCGTGPCMQINHGVYDEMLDDASLDTIIEACKNGHISEWGAK